MSTGPNDTLDAVRSRLETVEEQPSNVSDLRPLGGEEVVRAERRGRGNAKRGRVQTRETVFGYDPTAASEAPGPGDLRRLEEILLCWCENKRTPQDYDYGRLRWVFIKHPATRDVAPIYLQMAHDWDTFRSYLAQLGHDPAKRQQHIRNTLQEAFGELVYGRVGTSGRKPSATDASRWTGRPTAAQRAARVLELAPIALEGLGALIAGEEYRLGNYPPEAIAPDTLAALRALQFELQALLTLAEQGHSVARRLAMFRNLTAKVFTFASEQGQLLIAGTAPVAQAALPAWATYAVCSMLGMGMETSGTIAAAGLTVAGLGQSTVRRAHRRANM